MYKSGRKSGQEVRLDLMNEREEKVRQVRVTDGLDQAKVEWRATFQAKGR
jgi:hypothetical protein